MLTLQSLNTFSALARDPGSSLTENLIRTVDLAILKCFHAIIAPRIANRRRAKNTSTSGEAIAASILLLLLACESVLIILLLLNSLQKLSMLTQN